MTIVRNISRQAFILNRKGAVVQLLPSRAAAVTAAELKSSQVQNLLKKGFIRLEKIEKPKKVKTVKSIKEKTSTKAAEKKTDNK